jgi:hypothetical protein
MFGSRPNAIATRRMTDEMDAEVGIEPTIPIGCVMSAFSVPWLVSAIKWWGQEGFHLQRNILHVIFLFPAL